MKPLLLELVPLIILGFGWLAIRNMDKNPEKGGWLAKRLARVRWDSWIVAIVAAVVLALVITKAVL